MQVLLFWTLRSQAALGCGSGRARSGEDHHSSDGRGGAGAGKLRRPPRLPRRQVSVLGLYGAISRPPQPEARGISPPSCASAAAANWPKDVAEGLCQQLRLGDGGEVPAAVVFVP